MQVMECRLVYEPRGKPIARRQLNSPDLVVEYMRDAFLDRPYQESVWVILLDRKNKPHGRHMVSVGSTTACTIDPCSTLRAAIIANATSVIVVHNHPSGDPAPSFQDVRATRVIHAACKAVGITMLDHVIIGRTEDDPKGKGWHSFHESGTRYDNIGLRLSKPLAKMEKSAERRAAELAAACFEACKFGINPIEVLRAALKRSVQASAAA